MSLATSIFEDLPEDDFRRHNPRFQGENFAKNLAVVDKVNELASAKDASPGQLALAWVLAQGIDIVPIPGTTKVANLEQNVAATDIELTADDLAQIDAIAPAGVAAGERYPDMSSIDR